MLLTIAASRRSNCAIRRPRARARLSSCSREGPAWHRPVAGASRRITIEEIRVVEDVRSRVSRKIEPAQTVPSTRVTLDGHAEVATSSSSSSLVYRCSGRGRRWPWAIEDRLARFRMNAKNGSASFSSSLVLAARALSRDGRRDIRPPPPAGVPSVRTTAVPAGSSRCDSRSWPPIVLRAVRMVKDEDAAPARTFPSARSAR